MKKALIKDSVKQIKNTFKRFVSILLMAFLGVGFFAGIRATSPDMINTIDKYYDEQNVYDIQVVSTLGLTSEDLQEISKIEGVDQIEGSFEKDALIKIEKEEVVVKLLSSKNINTPLLIEGNLPQNTNECVVEKSFLESKNKKIGDFIELKVEHSKNDEGEEIQYLKNNNLKIVGVVESPLYISNDRGTSTLGAGKIDYFMYISEDNINANNVYTQIYVKMENSNTYTTSSDEYEKNVEILKNRIEQIKSERETARYNELIDTATEKLNDAEEKFNTEKNDAETQLAEARAEIENGKKEIEDVEAEIIKNEKSANNKFSEAEKQIESAKQQLSKSESEFTSKELEANKNFEELEIQKKSLQKNLDTINTGSTTVNEQYNQVLENLKDESLSDEQKQTLLLTKQTLEAKIEELNKDKTEVESGISQINQGIESGKKELQQAKSKLEDAKNTIQKQEKELNNTKKATYAQIESAKKKIEDSKTELELAEDELVKNEQEFNEKINEAEQELIDAKTQIADIESPTWYIFDRHNNDGYDGFIQDSQSIKSIGVVFPVVFFVVATLISLTSMTRMVEEQRSQIGTLKALGYNKAQIISKYVIYAALATIIGGISGMCVGFQLIPRIIIKMYQMMYQLSNPVIEFNFYYGAIGLGLISFCIIGATIYVALKELVHTPANLMRPKSPKMGKRVFLERIPFIWNRLSFSKKVTVRNIFRYKKRFLMTIIGIFGCTSLILAGFGLKDSIKSILPAQYENVFNYDMQITLKSSISEEQKNNYVEKLKSTEKIQKVVSTYMISSTVKYNENEEDVIIIVPEDENNLDGLINIKDAKTKQQVQLKQNEICITDKAAQLLDIKNGDTVKLIDTNDNEIEVKVSDIVENYAYHYVYMSKQTYENLYNKNFNANVLYTQNIDLTDEETENLSKDIINDNEVSGVSVISTVTKRMSEMMNSLNYVVIILIVSAGLLAFVVLYNLQNVNISERIRELATIKVLGFYDKEVYLYVTRETILLTIIGIALGLIGGYFLNAFILNTCEIDMLRFNKIINPISYIYSILITVGFSIIVNIVTYFALKKINMVESLKSIE